MPTAPRLPYMRLAALVVTSFRSDAEAIRPSKHSSTMMNAGHDAKLKVQNLFQLGRNAYHLVRIIPFTHPLRIARTYGRSSGRARLLVTICIRSPRRWGGKAE